MRTIALIFTLSVTWACQQGKEAEAARAVTPPGGGSEAAPKLPSQPAASSTVPAADPTPRLTLNADGTIRLQVVDRWGAAFDSTYEDVTYLRRALPVLSRGLSAEQNAELERSLDALK